MNLPSLLRRAMRKLAAYGPALVVSAVIGGLAIRSILLRVGHPALPLDDSFIHLTYARRLAEGSFFAFVPGGSYTTGATSFLWPVVLAPFYRLGFHGLSLVWVAWLFGLVGHAAVAVEAKRLAEPLAGRAAAIAAGAMCAVFGAFAWFAWSGMETIFLAWVLLRTARVAAEHAEGPRDRAGELILLALLGPLVRPEGVIGSLIAALALFAVTHGRGHARRALALVALIGPLIVPALHLAFTGHATSSTTAVKWLVTSPYLRGAELRAAILEHARVLFAELINGEGATALFLPLGARVPILLGLVVLPIAAARHRRPLRALFIAAIALGALIACTYMSFFWNRMRYIWPFAGAWFVLAACATREVGDGVRWVAVRLRAHAPWARWVTPLLAFSFVGAIAVKLPAAFRDLAESAHAIDRQQVTLGRWASKALPAKARIGLNDTGAIAYFSERPTFDVVGLTTQGEARHWVAGAGSRFEHYEAMPRNVLPTHFIVYPAWMAMPALLGPVLKQATVKDQSILGGTTMIAYEARYELLGSGNKPTGDASGERIVDEVDVADLDSEQAHGYELDDATDFRNRTAVLTRDALTIAEGGRWQRARDRFFVSLEPGREQTLVLRLDADSATAVDVTVAGQPIGTVHLAGLRWVDKRLPIPKELATGKVTVEVTRSKPQAFTSYHYWVVAP
jgi:hypothetical protein